MVRNGAIVERLIDEPAPCYIAAFNRVGAPANLLHDEGKRPRPLPPAPAVNKGPPAAVFFGEWTLNVISDIAGYEGRAKLACFEGADLLVDSSNLGPLVV